MGLWYIVGFNALTAIQLCDASHIPLWRPGFYRRSFNALTAIQLCDTEGCRSVQPRGDESEEDKEGEKFQCLDGHSALRRSGVGGYLPDPARDGFNALTAIQLCDLVRRLLRSSRTEVIEVVADGLEVSMP